MACAGSGGRVLAPSPGRWLAGGHLSTAAAVVSIPTFVLAAAGGVGSVRAGIGLYCRTALQPPGALVPLRGRCPSLPARDDSRTP